MMCEEEIQTIEERRQILNKHIDLTKERAFQLNTLINCFEKMFKEISIKYEPLYSVHYKTMDIILEKSKDLMEKMIGEIERSLIIITMLVEQDSGHKPFGCK